MLTRSIYILHATWKNKKKKKETEAEAEGGERGGGKEEWFEGSLERVNAE